MKNIFSAILLCTAGICSAAEAPLWLRDAKISPDGTTIAFTYKGDIFTVPAAGGYATRITAQPTYETSPIWSPDSKTLAFCSDRHGNFDIYTVRPDANADWTRLTFNSAAETPQAFTPDGKAVLFSAAIADPAQSALYPSSRMSELYSVPVDGGAPKQILATPALSVAWAPDGKSFLYQDVKGFEDTWRKHHTSSVTRDIWRYTPSTNKHEKIIDAAGEDLDPVQVGADIYFLSERAPQKSLNIYKAPIGDTAHAKALTNFKTHPVRFLSASDNGTLAFTYDGELYTMAPGGKPQKVKVLINADFPDEVEKTTATRGARGAVPSPDGKQIAFTVRGDVFVTAVDYKTTKQISSTPEAEADVWWANDSVLYYSSERNGLRNIYRATFERTAEEPDFAHATVIKEEPVFKADSHERSVPRISPDGKTLGFILDRTKLAVMDLDSKKVRQLTDGSTHRSRTGGFDFFWSPDSRWIALDICDRKHEPYTDVAIINVADGTLTNLTNSGYFDADPKWIMDGNAIAFTSERLGMRNHASWGSQSDVFYIFLNRDAYNRFCRSKEEREIFDKKAKETKTPKTSKNAQDSQEPIVVELDGIGDRQVRVTPMSTDLIDFVTDNDGRMLYFMSHADDDDAFIWKYDLDEGSLSMKQRYSDAASHFATTPDGKNIFLLGGKAMNKFGDKLKAINYNARRTLDHAAERRYMFDNIEREERERFYTADMHGVDWKSLSNDYRRFLPHINNNYDFAEMVSEWLGELNVSHTGGRYRTGGSDAAAPDRTASLGAIYDMQYTGQGVRIAEILPQSPLEGQGVSAGDIITAIDGQDITVEIPLDRLLADAAGRRTQLSIKPAGNGKNRNIVVRPISTGAMDDMLHQRWVRRRAATVDSLSHGRLGYVHLAAMDDDSFRKAYSDLLGKYNDREGVVIDIRWNGGGRLHEDIEVLLSGQKYFTQEIRGDEICDMPSRRWNKPSIMIIAEPCYSNAHGTPWVYKHRGLGKLVGMPVAGTMTSVNWVTMQDPGLVYGIPVVGYRLADGSVLENQQLEPDIKVANDPADIVRGRDAQLEAAVKELLKEIDNK